MRILLCLFCVFTPILIYCAEDDAIIGLTAVLENDPSDTVSRIQRAEAYYKLEKNKECIDDLKIVLRTCPNKKIFSVFAKICEEDTDWSALLEGCKIMKNAGAEKSVYSTIEELASFGMAVKENPKDSESRKKLGKLYGKMNRIEQAIREFEKVLENDKYDTSAILYLAQCYEFLEKEELASNAYKRYYDLTRDEKTSTKLNELEKKSIYRDDFDRKELGSNWVKADWLGGECSIENGKLTGNALLKREINGEIGIEFDWYITGKPKSGVVIYLDRTHEYFAVSYGGGVTYMLYDGLSVDDEHPRNDWKISPDKKKYKVCIIKKAKARRIIVDGKEILEGKAKKLQVRNEICFCLPEGNAIDNVRIFKP